MMSSYNARNNAAVTITVIIATYNRAHYLREALESVVAQTRPADEIIVVNDGSTDDTAQVLGDFGARIRVIDQANSGKPAALNRALAEASGSHTWIFDDDDIALPDALETHTAFLAANPAVDFSIGRNYTFDGDDNIWTRERWRVPDYTQLENKPLLLALLYDCELIFQALLVPTDCFRAMGGFDKTLGRAEDYDMLIKLARHYRGGDTGSPTMVWRNHSGERGAIGERHADSERARLFRDYERTIFRRVWHDFDLSEYRSGDEPSRTGDLDAARLMRCQIMFHHDLLALGAADLKDLLAAAGQDPVNRRAMIFTINRAADIGDPVFVATACERARHLAAAINTARGSNDLRLAALKGFYWSLRRAWRQRRRADARVLVRAGLVFVAQSALAVAPRR